MAWILPTNQIDISARISYGASWADVDVSADVPAGTKGVILRIENNSTGTYNANTRPNGNTEDRSAYCKLKVDGHKCLPAKLDSNRIFEGYFSNSALKVYIIAYTDDDTFFQNSINISQTSYALWLDQDLSAYIPTGSELAVLELLNISSVNYFAHGVRKNGNVEDDYRDLTDLSNTLGLVGLDENIIIEHKSEGASSDAYLWGHIINSVALTPAPLIADVTKDNTWRDVDCSGIVPVGTIGVILQAGATMSSGSNLKFNVRKKGSTDDFSTDIQIGERAGPMWTVVGLDTNRTFQINWGSNVNCRIVGYITGGAIVAPPEPCLSLTACESIPARPDPCLSLTECEAIPYMEPPADSLSVTACESIELPSPDPCLSLTFCETPASGGPSPVLSLTKCPDIPLPYGVGGFIMF